LEGGYRMYKYLLLKKWILRTLVIVLGGLSLGSCSIQSQRAEISKPLDIDLSVREAFLSKDFIPSDWTSESWWEMFNDPQLNHFIETTLTNNPTIQAAVETVVLAHDSAKQAFSPLLPSVDAEFKEALFAFDWRGDGVKVPAALDALLPKNILPNWINFLGYTLSFKWSLDIWGKQTKLYKAALDDMKAQLANAAYSKLLLSVQVANSYMALQYHLQMKGVQEELLQVQSDMLLIYEQMFTYALADEMDIQISQKSAAQTRLQLLSTSEDITKKQYELKVYMGISPDQADPIQMPTACFDQPFPLPDQVSFDLLARRPDIVTKIWAIQAATKRVNSAKVAFFPSIDLASLSGFFDLKYKDVLEPKSWFTSIIPGVTLPLFHGLNLRNKLKYSLRQYNLAVYDYNQLLLNATQEVVESMISFQIAGQRIEEQKGILGANETLLELSGMRFEYGLNTYLQVLESEIISLNDHMTYVQLVEMRLLSILSLIKSIGGGYNNPNAQIDMEQDFIYE